MQIELYDNDILRIKNIKWLPFVGNKYFKTDENNRFMLIGESHYHNNSEESIKKHNNQAYTRIVIQELAIDRKYWGTKIFQNIHRVLLRNDKFNTKLFWNSVSYYNFIQRPMDTNKGRPSNQEFYEGWKVFLELIKILKPKTCLFIGTSAANSLIDATKGTDYTCEKVSWEDYISNAYAKTAILKDKSENETKLVFIRHASSMFSWTKWNDYLQKTIPNELNWIGKQTENIKNTVDNNFLFINL